MDTKSKKKGDAFAAELEVLLAARERLANSASDPDAMREGYVTIVDEYEKLLDEVKFLTKISDKLESRLTEANEKLQIFNKELSTEAESATTEKLKVLEKNKKLYADKTELDHKVNKFQLTLIIVIAILAVTIIYLFYYIFVLVPEHGGKAAATH